MALHNGDTTNDKPVAPQANVATVTNYNVLQLTQLVEDLQQEVKSLKTKNRTSHQVTHPQVKTSTTS